MGKEDPRRFYSDFKRLVWSVIARPMADGPTSERPRYWKVGKGSMARPIVGHNTYTSSYDKRINREEPYLEGQVFDTKQFLPVGAKLHSVKLKASRESRGATRD
jgi:hypothetical protein